MSCTLSRRSPRKESRRRNMTLISFGSGSRSPRITTRNGRFPNRIKERSMKKATKPIQVKGSSGNVFADLGLPNPQDALAKAKLASRICQVIEQRGLTQTQAAEILGLDQPKISA